MSEKDITFGELRSKDLVNACDGKKIGRASDLVFDVQSGKIRGIIAPFSKKSWCNKGQDVFIPFKCIVKFGQDVVLVDMNCHVDPGKPDCKEKGVSCEIVRPNCDMKCEKCMIFDCAYRWKNN